MIKAKEKQKVINPCVFFWLCCTLFLSLTLSVAHPFEQKTSCQTWEVTSKSCEKNKLRCEKWRKKIPSNFSTMLSLRIVVYNFFLLHQYAIYFTDDHNGTSVYVLVLLCWTQTKIIQTSFRELNKDSKQSRKEKKNTEKIVEIFPAFDCF